MVLPDIEPLMPGDCFGYYQMLAHQRLQHNSLATLRPKKIIGKKLILLYLPMKVTHTELLKLCYKQELSANS